MSNYEKIQLLRNLLLEICDNVQDYFIYPTEYAELNQEFPYITFVLGSIEFVDQSSRAQQNINIIAFVKEDNKQLTENILSFSNKIFEKLYKNKELQLNISEISYDNIFQPFGLGGGVFPPFAAVRYKIKLPFSLK